METSKEISLEAIASADRQDMHYPEDNWSPYEAAHREHVSGYELGAQKWKTKCDELEQWKREAILVMNPIMDYGQSHPDIKLGQSISTFVVDRCKRHDELKAENEALKTELNDSLNMLKNARNLLFKAESVKTALEERAEKMADALRYIVQRDYTGASFVAQEALSNWKEGEQKGGEG